jgi:hypothetical protein
VYWSLRDLKSFLGSAQFSSYITGQLGIRRVHVSEYGTASHTEHQDPLGKFSHSTVILTTDVFCPNSTGTLTPYSRNLYAILHELMHAYSFNHGISTGGDPYSTVVDFGKAAGWNFGFAQAFMRWTPTQIAKNSEPRFFVSAPGYFPTAYAGRHMSEDFAETATHFALLWLAESGPSSAYFGVYDHLSKIEGYTSLKDLDGRLEWMQEHFSRNVTKFEP